MNMEAKIQKNIEQLALEQARQTQLLIKSLEMNFKPVNKNDEMLTTATRCGSAVSVEDHFRWLEQCDEWTTDMENDEYESERDKRVAGKKQREMKERWKPKWEQCKSLGHDDDYYLGLADKLANDFCERFQVGLDRKHPDSIYPEKCGECETMRSPGSIRGQIKVLAVQLNENQKYLKNMQNSDYIENENAENHCSSCAWMDVHGKPFDGPFCAQREMLVNSEAGSCSKFWVGLIPKN